MTSGFNGRNGHGPNPAAILMLAGAMIVSGCASQHAPATVAQSPVYDLPPPQLADQVKRIVSSPPIALPVRDQSAGAIVTGWQGPFRGDWHVLRYWHERTRYHIAVVPDFTDPARRGRIEVTDETEQRPDESGPNAEARTWHAAPDIHRPERSQAVLRQIESQLRPAPAATLPAQ